MQVGFTRSNIVDLKRREKKGEEKTQIFNACRELLQRTELLNLTLTGNTSMDWIMASDIFAIGRR